MTTMNSADLESFEKIIWGELRYSESYDRWKKEKIEFQYFNLMFIREDHSRNFLLLQRYGGPCSMLAALQVTFKLNKRRLY